jgi:hypothetical protein
MAVGWLCGLGGVVAGIAGGNLPLMIGAAAAIVGVTLVPSVVHWCRTNVAVEATRRQYRGQTREEMLAEIRATFAPVEREFESDDSGRFQELVSGQHQPAWHRVH